MTAQEHFKRWHPPALANDPVEEAYVAGWNACTAHNDAVKAANVQNLGGGEDYTGPGNGLRPEDIWAHWPIKKARGAAVVAIAKAMKKCAPAMLLKHVQEFAGAISTWPVEDRQFVPMCSTWMNQERWLDDRSTWQRGTPAPKSQFGRSH